jgi:hypothetical protein
VKVKLPWLGDPGAGWARIPMRYAVPSVGGTGLYSVPEVDDEVLILFEHGGMASP